MTVNFCRELGLGSGESVQSIRVHDKVIISMAGNNRIAWHTFNDKEVSRHELPLRPLVRSAFSLDGG